MAIKVVLASGAEETLDRMTQIVAEADGVDLVQLVRTTSGIQDAIDRNPEAEILVVDRALDGGRGLAVARGLGATNHFGEYVDDRPVHYRDGFATLYHNLGIDTRKVSLTDTEGRPYFLLPGHEPIAELV